jgi:hypothetical protein
MELPVVDERRTAMGLRRLGVMKRGEKKCDGGRRRGAVAGRGREDARGRRKEKGRKKK